VFIVLVRLSGNMSESVPQTGPSYKPESHSSDRQNKTNCKLRNLKRHSEAINLFDINGRGQ